MSELAKDVAKELDRRAALGVGLIFAAVWAALIALALVYVRCGGSWGLGGRGSGAGSGAVTASDAGPHRCAIRVASNRRHRRRTKQRLRAGRQSRRVARRAAQMSS